LHIKNNNNRENEFLSQFQTIVDWKVNSMRWFPTSQLLVAPVSALLFPQKTLITRAMSTASTSSSSSTKFRTVAQTHQTELEKMRPGFSTRSLRAGLHLATEFMDPFVNLDNFWMDQPTFPPHPHAGFSAVTYMLPDSPGSFQNRWSIGESSRIGPGAIHWTQAGSGMIHEEIPTEPGITCHGIQMFVKLPAAKELTPPVAFHQDHPPQVILQDGVSRVRILAGSFQGQSALLEIGNTNLQHWDVTLATKGTISIPAPSDQTSFILVLNGAVQTPDGTVISPNTGAAFAMDGDTVQLTAGGGDKEEEAQFLYCSGTPNRESMVSSGPFMMSTEERLAQAKVDYRDGKMGQLKPSF
jgi:redox-sensitive bicupin YhaK (pirin superfamily)